MAVPDASLPDQYYNYLVNIVKTADAYIDYYQVQAYNDWYEFPGGSLQYLQNVYLNWRNLQGMSQWGSTPIANFEGVKASKLVMGVLGSQGGGSGYYCSETVLGQFKEWLKGNNYEVRGFMIWNSKLDAANLRAVSSKVVAP